MNHLMTRAFGLALAAAVSAACLTACETNTAGIKSNYLQQYDTLNADVETVAAAAEDVLNEYELENISSKSTKLDGEVRGQMADGTKVWVTLKQEGDERTETTVQVGKAGDSELGQEILSKIRDEVTE